MNQISLTNQISTSASKELSHRWIRQWPWSPSTVPIIICISRRKASTRRLPFDWTQLRRQGIGSQPLFLRSWIAVGSDGGLAFDSNKWLAKPLSTKGCETVNYIGDRGEIEKKGIWCLLAGMRFYLADLVDEFVYHASFRASVSTGLRWRRQKKWTRLSTRLLFSSCEGEGHFGFLFSTFESTSINWMALILLQSWNVWVLVLKYFWVWLIVVFLVHWWIMWPSFDCFWGF